jgi:hypothetical protein
MNQIIKGKLKGYPVYYRGRSRCTKVEVGKCYWDVYEFGTIRHEDIGTTCIVTYDGDYIAKVLDIELKDIAKNENYVLLKILEKKIRKY